MQYSLTLSGFKFDYDNGIIASRKQVEITNLFPVCKFKDKDHLKTTKVNIF